MVTASCNFYVRFLIRKVFDRKSEVGRFPCRSLNIHVLSSIVGGFNFNPFLKNMHVKMGVFRKVRGENLKK